jgi:hypothetical protein
MLSAWLEYLCTELECFYRVGMLSRWLECRLEGWNAFNRVGIRLYRVGMLSTALEYVCTELECFRQSWNTFVQGCNAF